MVEWHGSQTCASVGDNNQKADYSLTMRYDNMHNITYKKQDLVQQNIKFEGIFNTGYELNYTINPINSQQISNIADASYSIDRGNTGTYTSGKQATDEVTNKTQAYGYDANGNLLYIHKGQGKPDSIMQVTSTRRMLWDEENRLLAINDNGFVSNYWYDASGERTVKTSGGSLAVYVNGVQSATQTETTNFTAYISPYLVVSNGGNYTKHVYIGSQRITSKLSNAGIFTTSPVNDTLQTKYALQTAKIKERFDTLGIHYNGTQHTGGLVSLNPTTTAHTYFYHPDHLGSSSLITDGTGHAVQHIQYVPFGEVFIEQRNSTWNTPYKFNGKELDAETGLYYYHARYYDQRTSVWLSVDPLAEKKPWLNGYHYCSNNPVNRLDLDGMEDKDVNQLRDIEKWRNFNTDKDRVILNEIIVSGERKKNIETQRAGFGFFGNSPFQAIEWLQTKHIFGFIDASPLLYPFSNPSTKNETIYEITKKVDFLLNSIESDKTGVKMDLPEVEEPEAYTFYDVRYDDVQVIGNRQVHGLRRSYAISNDSLKKLLYDKKNKDIRIDTLKISK